MEVEPSTAAGAAAAAATASVSAADSAAVAHSAAAAAAAGGAAPMQATSSQEADKCELCDIVLKTERAQATHYESKRHLQNAEIQQTRLVLQQCGVFARGFPPGTTQDALRNELEAQFGRLTEVVIACNGVQISAMYAHLIFADPASRQACLAASPWASPSLGRLVFKPRTLPSLIKAADKGAKRHKRKAEAHRRMLAARTEIEHHRAAPDAKPAAELGGSSLTEAVRAQWSKEIAAYVAQHKPSEETEALREAGLARLTKVVRKAFPKTSVQLDVFGSFAAGLATLRSDCDVSVDIEPRPRQAARAEFLADIYRVLKHNTHFECMLRNSQTRCPVIAATYIAPSPEASAGDQAVAASTSTRKKMSFDITFDNKLAIRNTALLRVYCASAPEVEALAVMAREWADRQHIFCNGYSMTLLALGFLQSQGYLASRQAIVAGSSCALCAENRPGAFGLVPTAIIDKHNCSFCPHEQPPAKPLPPVAVLLVDFFCFLATTPLGELGCSVRKGGMVPRASLSLSDSPLMIEDPFELQHNTAHMVTPVHVEYLQLRAEAALHKLAAGAVHGNRLVPIVMGQPKRLHSKSMDEDEDEEGEEGEGEGEDEEDEEGGEGDEAAADGRKRKWTGAQGAAASSKTNAAAASAAGASEKKGKDKRRGKGKDKAPAAASGTKGRQGEKKAARGAAKVWMVAPPPTKQPEPGPDELLQHCADALRGLGLEVSERGGGSTGEVQVGATRDNWGHWRRKRLAKQHTGAQEGGDKGGGEGGGEGGDQVAAAKPKPAAEASGGAAAEDASFHFGAHVRPTRGDNGKWVLSMEPDPATAGALAHQLAMVLRKQFNDWK